MTRTTWRRCYGPRRAPRCEGGTPMTTICESYCHGGDRNCSLNDVQMPNFRVVRVALGTRYNPVEGKRRASRNGPVGDLPPEIPNVAIRTFSIARVLVGRCLRRRLAPRAGKRRSSGSPRSRKSWTCTAPHCSSWVTQTSARRLCCRAWCLWCARHFASPRLTRRGRWEEGVHSGNTCSHLSTSSGRP